MCQAISDLKDDIKTLAIEIDTLYSDMQQLVDLRDRFRSRISGLNSVVSVINSRANNLNTRMDEARAVIEKPLADRVVAMLEGEYSLRTVSAIVDATGATRQELLEALDRNDIAYVLRRRSRDGAELIGLEDRS